jgi:hypothetical protein
MRNRGRTPTLAPEIRQCYQDAHFRVRGIQLGIDDEENLWAHQAKKLGGEPCLRFGGFFLPDYGRIKEKWSYRISSNRLSIDFRLFPMRYLEIAMGCNSFQPNSQIRHLLSALRRIFRNNSVNLT